MKTSFSTSVNHREKFNIKLAFSVLFVNSIIESFLFYFENRETIVFVQIGINLLFFLFLWFSKFKFRYSKLFNSIFLLVAYFFVLIIFSSNPLHSLNMLLKFSIPIFYLVVGYSFKTTYVFNYAVKFSWVFLMYFSLYFLVSNYLDLGYDLYRGGYKIGYNSLNSLYIPIFSLIVLLFFFNKISNKWLRVSSLIFSILTIAIFIAILKRTMLLLLLIGLIFYLVNTLNHKKVLQIFFLTIFSGLVFSTFFFEDFQSALDSRQSYFSDDYELIEEGRITENIYIFLIMKEKASNLIFGTGEIFNDRDYISFSYFNRSREIHNSYGRIFWNGGFFGLFLFLYFYFIQGKTMLKTYKLINDPRNIVKQIFWFGFVFVLLRAINDLSSGITYLGYNAYCYLLIGYLFRLSFEIEKFYKILKFRNQRFFQRSAKW